MNIKEVACTDARPFPRGGISFKKECTNRKGGKNRKKKREMASIWGDKCPLGKEILNGGRVVRRTH